MFTRIVECTAKPEKKEELRNKMQNEALPILQKQPGFVDLISLVSENDSNRLLSISFWRTREDAERYQRENYNRVLDIVKPLLKTTPEVETFNVEHSTTHRIAAGKAA